MYLHHSSLRTTSSLQQQQQQVQGSSRASSAGSRGSGSSSSSAARKYYDTQNLLDGMMKEAKLTPFQMKMLKTSVNEMGTLPSDVPSTNYMPDYQVKYQKYQEQANPFELRKNYGARRKNQQAIMRDNPPERDNWVPRPAKFNREKEKIKLSRIMEYDGKPPPPLPPQEALPPPPPPPKDRFTELMEEIEERKQWLEDMRALGKAHLYERDIKAEISMRLAEMKRLDKKATEEELARHHDDNYFNNNNNNYNYNDRHHYTSSTRANNNNNNKSLVEV